MTWIWVLVAITLGWVIYAAPAKPGPGQIVPFQSLFVNVAGGRWPDRAAQAQAESQFDPFAQSPVGAKGLFQAMDPTWRDYERNGWVPKGSSPFDPLPAIQGGCKYMGWLEPRVGGHLAPALAAFNWGIGHILQVQRRVKAIGEPSDQAWIRLCPEETQSYLKNNAYNRAAIERRLKP